ncbi:MAG TPA: DUF5131 family protein [Paracoccaceae bacterium]|nr:DUF5131 family protein [Paracoccaceae bacterium]
MDFRGLWTHCPTHDFHSGFCIGPCPDRRRLDWIITGGESGPGARPAHPDWFRQVRDHCAEAGVAFFHKQNGAWEMAYDRDRDDPDWRRFGEVERETPKGRWVNLAGGHGFHGDRVLRIVPIGKAHAGRLLDGREYNGLPRTGSGACPEARHA